MNKLLFENGNIVLTGELIENWEHNMFFTINLGFLVDYSKGNLTLPFEKDGFQVLSNIIEYFDSQNLEYETDEVIRKYFQIIYSEQGDYLKAKKQIAEMEAVDKPSRLKRELKSYQLDAFRYGLSAIHSANFSVPGSGKTTVVYSIYAYLQQLGIVDKIFVVGPNSSFLPWEEESKLCFGEQIISARLSGSRQVRERIYYQSDKFELFLCFYQTLANDIDKIINLLSKYNFLLVIDESHNIKKLDDGVWAQAALQISRYAKRRIILSGTPVPNNLNDLWTQLTFLWPGEYVLGRKEEFRATASDTNNITKIKQRVSPFIYRVTKDDLGLPEPKFKKYRYQLSPYQGQIYEALSKKYLSELNYEPIENKTLRYWRRAKIIRLIQTASNPSLLAKYSDEFDVPPLDAKDSSIIDLIDRYSMYEMPAKIIGGLELIDDLVREGKKVLLWTSFIQNIVMLESSLLNKGYGIYKIYGDIPKDGNEDVEFNREQQIKDFKNSRDPSILLANPAACAESISLHKYCHDAIYLDRTFNCGQYLQSLDRIHRIGLRPDEHVTYHILLADLTIDETIDKRLLEKEELMKSILNDDLPIGGFEADENLIASSESEEVLDFKETMKDIKRHYG